ncbi:MAG: hypothetical protein LBI87_13765, partial [Candidatus Accumulibacter sp.]|nr:hypothetical protein [Accumulibacter sp.]
SRPGTPRDILAALTEDADAEVRRFVLETMRESHEASAGKVPDPAARPARCRRRRSPRRKTPQILIGDCRVSGRRIFESNAHESPSFQRKRESSSLFLA